MDLLKTHETGIGITIRFKLTESVNEVYPYQNEPSDVFTEFRDNHYVEDESGVLKLKSDKDTIQWIVANNNSDVVAFAAVRKGQVAAFHIETEYLGLGIREAVQDIFDDIVSLNSLSPLT